MTPAKELKIFDEKTAFAVGFIDPAIPVVPVLEPAFAFPVDVPPSALRPVPCTAPPDFLEMLTREEYSANQLFEKKFSRDSYMVSEKGDRIGGLHAAINVAGKVLHGLTFYMQDFVIDPTLRLLSNKIENAWLDYNAHSWQISPELELRYVQEMQRRIDEISGNIQNLLPETEPRTKEGKTYFGSPLFSMFLQSALLGARFVQLKGNVIKFEWVPGDATIISLDTGASPRAIGDELCRILIRLTQEEESHLGTSISASSDISGYLEARNTIRIRIMGSPTLPPRFYVTLHFSIKSTHAHMVPLESSDSIIYDKVIAPGETKWMSIRSWEGNPAIIGDITAYADTPLPEARDNLLHSLREVFPLDQDVMGDRAFVVPRDAIRTIPKIIKENILSLSQEANKHRIFEVKEIASEADALALGKVHPPNAPTQALGINLFKITNKKKTPLHVQYVATQKTYMITISFAKVTVLYWDGASKVEVGHERLPGILSTIFQPEIKLEDSPVLKAFRFACDIGENLGTYSFPVELHKPVAAPAGYIERFIKEFKVKSKGDVI